MKTMLQAMILLAGCLGACGIAMAQRPTSGKACFVEVEAGVNFSVCPGDSEVYPGKRVRTVLVYVYSAQRIRDFLLINKTIGLGQFEARDYSHTVEVVFVDCAKGLYGSAGVVFMNARNEPLWRDPQMTTEVLAKGPPMLPIGKGHREMHAKICSAFGLAIK